VRSGRAPPPKKRAKKAPAAARSKPTLVEREAPKHVIDALKRWRKLEAQRHGLPAFRILTDKVIDGIATLDPASEAELLQVKGLGLALVRKHGEALLAVLRDVR
jgi:DNA topoisomerase-3